jgi:hypothetical protein
MSRPWRGLAAVTLAAVLLTTLELPASAASATSSAVTITITAKSRLPRVTGDTLVIFKDKKLATATISGSITGAASGDVATLFARPFPYTQRAVPIGTPKTLNGTSPEPYSFTVTPGIATRYQVKVTATGTQVGSSAVRVVYVTAGSHFSNAKKCARPVCTQRLRVTFVIPASALRRESAKHLYFYFGLRLNRSRIPRLPRRLKLHAHARITRLGRRSAIRFQWRITWSFRIGRRGYNFNVAVCTKDTEAKDGVGLPGHHRCGVKSFSVAKTPYLGGPRQGPRRGPAGNMQPAT